MDKNNMQFSELNLSEEIRRAVAEMGFELATDIQSQTIPLILEGRDVIGHSQTGTGKTAAFGLPAIELLDPKNKRNPQILILCPTRELAMQASDEIRKFGRYKHGINVVCIYGGQPITRQIDALRRGASIIVGTPGRVMDHMRRRTLKLNDLKMIVLDEADEMLNMGFRDDIECILKDIPEERQTVLFSATMPAPILAITREYQKDPVHIKVKQSAMTVPSIEQSFYEVPGGKKIEALCRLIEANDIGLSMIFCNTKKMVDELVAELNLRGYPAQGLHGDMKQSSRTEVMGKFKSRKIPILVATDVAARGIDVDDVDAVVNFDLPTDKEYYVHRIGRTGRAGKTGRSITLISGRAQFYALKNIISLTKSQIIRKNLPTYNEIKKLKIEKYGAEIRKVLLEENLPDYAHILAELKGEEFTEEKIFSALVTMAFRNADGKEAFSYDSALDSPRPTVNRYIDDRAPRPRQTQQSPPPRINRASNVDYCCILLGVGRQQNILPANIVASITEKSGIPGRAIGNIDIRDKHTIVEIERKFKDGVLTSLTSFSIKGYKTNAEETDKKIAPRGFNERNFGNRKNDFNTRNKFHVFDKERKYDKRTKKKT